METLKKKSNGKQDRKKGWGKSKDEKWEIGRSLGFYGKKSGKIVETIIERGKGIVGKAGQQRKDGS